MSGEISMARRWLRDFITVPFQRRSRLELAFTPTSRRQRIHVQLVLSTAQDKEGKIGQVLANYTLHPSPGIGLGADFVRRLARRG